jgi:hypothetical protein
MLMMFYSTRGPLAAIQHHPGRAETKASTIASIVRGRAVNRLASGTAVATLFFVAGARLVV